MEKTLKPSPLPKISVVMAAFNAGHTVGQTIQNLISQTYKNIEIIIVNDGSSDATNSIVKTYQKTYQNIKLVSLKENVGPFKARIIGADNATGEFLHFIDADDYISADFYRTTLHKATKNNSDIVMGSIVLDFKNQGVVRDFPLINDLPFDSLIEGDIFKAFMNQGGLNFTYHMNSTKLYRMSLWKKARPFYDDITEHLIMADDVAMNVPLWYFANKLDRTPTATLFYVKDDNDSATSNYKITHKKMLKNLTDLFTVFDFFEKFLASQKTISTYQSALNNWKRSFVRVYQHNISNSTLTLHEKELLLQHLHGIAPFTETEQWLDTPYFHINTLWKDGLDDLKKKIAQPDISTVIFSLDSLVTPIILPNGKEKLLPRATGIELYDLAIFMNKKVLLASGKSDAVKKMLFLPNLELAKDIDFGIGSVSISLPRPIDIFIDRGLNLPFGYDYKPQTASAMLTVTCTIASYYFDNPYISFINDTAYSGRVTSVGYYSLGLQTFLAKNSPQPLKSPAQNILALSESNLPQNDDPYEIFVSNALRYGTQKFTTTISPLLQNALLDNIRNHAAAGLNLAVYTHNWFDRQLFHPLLYKYPRIIDTPGREQPSADHLRSALAGKRKVIKLAAYAIIDRRLIITALKRRARMATATHPTIDKALRNTYANIRKIKKNIK